MRSLKEGVQFLKETKNEGMAQATMMLYCPTKEQKMTIAKYFGAGTVLGSMMPVLAGAGEQLSNGIARVLDNIFKWVFGITTSLAAVLILIAFIQYMVSSDPQSAHMAKSRIFKIIFAWIAINCIGAIVQVVQELSTDAGSQWNGSGK